MEVWWPGSSRTIGKMLVEDTFITVMKASKDLFQRVSVPPCALDLVRGRSGSNKSSELSEQQYSESRRVMEIFKSHWKSHGSDKNISDGLY